METIKLNDFISKYPAYRISADKLFNYINNIKENDIIIDFINIEGITHSFASQYLNDKNLCKKNIKEINMNDNVMKMFETLNKKKRINNNNIEVSNFNL
ncbi:hypothetical protein [Acidiplasma aeolicum]|jgi:hypothetical protein|uniref:hypothetical protein n=1 Tax=Acidiplasma aeolicum TaxID=507754 RepID=UPI003722ACF9